MLTLTDENFDSEVATGVVLVKFTADWCNPCKQVQPILDSLEPKYSGKIKFAKVDVDNTSIAQKYSIRGVPTILLFAEHEIVNTLVGAQTKDRYELALNTAVDEYCQ